MAKNRLKLTEAEMKKRDDAEVAHRKDKWEATALEQRAKTEPFWEKRREDRKALSLRYNALAAEHYGKVA